MASIIVKVKFNESVKVKFSIESSKKIIDILNQAYELFKSKITDLAPISNYSLLDSDGFELNLNDVKIFLLFNIKGD